MRTNKGRKKSSKTRGYLGCGHEGIAKEGTVQRALDLSHLSPGEKELSSGGSIDLLLLLIVLGAHSVDRGNYGGAGALAGLTADHVPHHVDRVATAIHLRLPQIS